MLPLERWRGPCCPAVERSRFEEPAVQILYVENHGVFARIVTEKFLAAHELVVVPTLSGARQALARTAFDAILVDFDLDDGTGFELIVELRAAGNKIPIVAVSAKKTLNRLLVAAGATTAVSKLEFSKIGGVLDGLSGQTHHTLQ
jgi:CheY-like chemotaxis protein